VDNASGDGSADAVRQAFPWARVLEPGANLGFSAANNLGLRESRAAHVLVLNSDAEVKPGAVGVMLALLASRPDVGIVGPRTLYPDGRVQVSTGPRPTPLSEWRQGRLVRGVRDRRSWALREADARHAREHEPDWVSASCLLARRGALEAVGGFDEAYFLYQEDVDLCLRVRRAGWRILFTPRAEVVHLLGRSMAEAGARPRIEYHRSHLRFYRRHNGLRATLLLRLYFLVLSARPSSDRLEARELRRLALGGA
jgi:GT2 family glycosyltransferase